jgi:hypothetical protein
MLWSNSGMCLVDLPECLGRKWSPMQELSAPQMPLQHGSLSSFDFGGGTLAFQDCPVKETQLGRTTGIP